MSLGESSRAGRRRPRHRPLWRRPLVRLALAVVVAALFLLVGLSLGRALDEGPSPGGTRTSVRTLDPRPLPPVTVTVTG